MRHHDSPTNSFAVTLTAPGLDQLDGVVSVAEWNSHAPRRWSEFIVYLGRKLDCKVRVSGVWETHRGGVLHRHAVIQPLLPKSARTMSRCVRAAATSRGFGSSHCAALDAEGIQRWGAYITKDIGSSVPVPSVDKHTGEIIRSRHRRWSCSRNWGITLTKVRARPSIPLTRSSTTSTPSVIHFEYQVIVPNDP